MPRHKKASELNSPAPPPHRWSWSSERTVRALSLFSLLVKPWGLDNDDDDDDDVRLRYQHSAHTTCRLHLWGGVLSALAFLCRGIPSYCSYYKSSTDSLLNTCMCTLTWRSPSLRGRSTVAVTSLHFMRLAHTLILTFLHLPVWRSSSHVSLVGYPPVIKSWGWSPPYPTHAAAWSYLASGQGSPDLFSNRVQCCRA